MVPQFPYCIEDDCHYVPLDDCWYASPHLFFTCVLCPKNGRLPKNRTYTFGPDDIECTLVFFSTFEELMLPIKGPMGDSMVGRVPLIQLFLAGNSTSTIAHMFSKHKPTTRQQASHQAAPTQLLWADEGAAISTKSTRGCNGLGAASLAFGACQSIRL